MNRRGFITGKRENSIIALIIAISVLGVLLSGCHPCSFVECGSWVRVEAYIGENGALYLTIPDRTKYKYVDLLSFDVNQLKDERLGDLYWSFYKSKSPNSKIKQIGAPNDFPLEYGDEVPGTMIEVQPNDITNGVYVFGGFVHLTDENGRHPARITGKFVYYNGSVRNVKQ
ncbi:MAG: hypothetical protein HQM04_11160 [Magnetococcales bacterium]|nr:hypothetical protein [Magnetococcales bacterium]MBF0115582.1 hypothetical protein [Magnetococcales bacterium]